MILKYIYLYLNLDEYPKEIYVPFGFRTRYLCNYIERGIKYLKFEVSGFNRICIQGTSVPSGGSTIQDEKAIVSKVGFDVVEYESLKGDEFHEFYISMLVKGLSECSREHAIPLNAILEIIESFREGGYRNEWVFQKKLFREQNIEAILLCRLDVNNFVLTLRLNCKKEVIFEQEILKTKPDEIIYTNKFKSLEVSDGAVLVVDKFGNTVFSTALPRLNS
ncbi:hypothetical protein [Pseudomonas aegrilactucae]|uniref:Uncharacterized protein n=1 Tax=Pseudomonas aegrilactucae TaxID=2854028 RepID=A0A9Q2XS05_9PSED|nr:hypothetical protein [Pseudomonas aegrilactucae]MBV6290499.1 hypothetical protein [Pseudomonas aegrilactucae]